MDRTKRLALALGAAALLALSAPASAAAQELQAPRADAGEETPGQRPPDAVSGATGAAEAVSGASPGAEAPKPFLGFRSKVAFHRAAGWTSAGLFLAAGAAGAVRAWNLMSEGHGYRDSLGMDEEDEIGSECSARIEALWKKDQALRWTHVGLIAAGESLYLADAITGVSWIDRSRPASTRSKLHRWAFFAHAALMAAEMVLGFVTTDALARGDHELVSSLGAAHAAIGFAIPVAIAAAGVVESLPAD